MQTAISTELDAYAGPTVLARISKDELATL
jgi:hypothetical protein